MDKREWYEGECMKTFLVTGAAGFIGAAITKRLLDEGYYVITIDNLTTGLKKNIPNGCEFIYGNDFDDETLNGLMDRDIDGIVHIAGQSSGEVSFSNPIYDLRTNTESTLKLLDFARKKNIEKFIYASSMAVYGDQDPNFVDEKSATVPKSFYAVGKLASENYMNIFSELGVQCTALRFFNVYGIGQNMENLKQGMVSIYLAMALKDHHIKIKGASDRFRDFVYIDDVVNAIWLAIHRKAGKKFEIYNVSSGTRKYVSEVIDGIQKRLEPNNISVEYITGTPGDQKGVYGNNKKIYQDLGWKPSYDFNSGLTLMVDWAKKDMESE